MKQALQAFQQALDATTIPNGELVALSDAGWKELCPSEECWHFTHPDFPEVRVDWSPNSAPRIHFWNPDQREEING